MTPSFAMAAPSQIQPSKTNPRKTFRKIEELADSAKKHGIISPLLVRQHPGSASGLYLYELVAGERRLRAAKMAKLAEVPILIRELSDKEVAEIQFIENIQREDVHPLEEADGYEALISDHGYDVEQLAARIDKSKAYVYARLKLTSLAPYPRQAFLEERLSPSVALLIARIADVELQERATRDVLGETEDYGDTSEEIQGDLDDPQSPLALERRTITTKDDDGFPAIEKLPMSVREAQIHLQRRYMLRLAFAKFEVADVQLVPSAGACTTCDFRTGNQRELFADVDSADVCTKPSCFETKTRASWDRKASAAEDAGVKVIAAEDASKVFTPSAQVRPTSPYVDPKSTVPLDLMPAGTTKAPTWSKLLGKALGSDEAPYVLVQDLTGAGHELLDKKAAIEVLREKGKIDKPLKPSAAASSSSASKDPYKEQQEKDPYKEQQEKELKKREQWTRAARAALDESWSKSKKLDLKDPEWWRWIVGREISATSPSDLPGDVGHADDLLKQAKSIEGFMQLLTVVMLTDAAQLPNGPNSYLYQDPAKDKELQAGLEMLGIDYAAHLERIKASDKEAAKAEKQIAAKSETKPATKPKKKGGR